MSRFALFKVLNNYKDLDELCSSTDEPILDIKGNSLDEWFADAVVGWDSNMESFFINCYPESKTGWALGVNEKIATFDEFCAVMERIFNENVSFDFNQDLLMPE
jgi:hypothetical protein